MGFQAFKQGWLPYAALAALSFIGVYISIKLASDGMTPLLFALVLNLANALGHFFILLRGSFARGGAAPGISRFFMRPGSLMIALGLGGIAAINDTSAFYMFQNGAPVSVAIPVFTAGSVFLTVIFALFVLRESLTLTRTAGLFLIILAIGLINV